MRLPGLVRKRVNAAPETWRVLWGHAALLFLASRIGDVVNLFTATFLVPTWLSENELGAVEPVTRLAAFGATPLAIVSTVAVKYLSSYHAEGAYGRIKRVLRDMAILGVASSVIFIVFLTFSFRWFGVRLNVESPYLLPALCALAVLSCSQPIACMMLQGLQRFRIICLNAVAEPVMRIIFVVILVSRFQLTGYLAAVFLGGLTAIAITAFGLRDFIGRTRIPGESYYEDLREMLGYTWPVAIMIVTASFQGFVEPFAVKHFLSSADAAGYYMVSRIGYIPSYLIGSVGFVLFPVLSYRHRRGDNTANYLGQALLVSLLLSGTATAVLGIGARWIFGLREGWQPFQAYAPYVWRMGLIATCTAVASVYATHEMAARRFSFLWIVVPVTAVELVVLYGSLGFSAFHSLLPADTWEAMSRLFPRSLGYVMWIMLGARAVIVVGLAMNWQRHVSSRGTGEPTTIGTMIGTMMKNDDDQDNDRDNDSLDAQQPYAHGSTN